MDYNSNANQQIKRKFVEMHVYANVNQMVEYILDVSQEHHDGAPFSFEDIENRYVIDYDQLFDYLFDNFSLEEIHEACEEEDIPFNDKENSAKQTLLDMDEEEWKEIAEYHDVNLSDFEEFQEIFEWWICSDFLISRLMDIGEPVLYDEDIWGRCTTGQAIMLDYSISKICEDMEILEGQANSWENLVNV